MACVTVFVIMYGESRKFQKTVWSAEHCLLTVERCDAVLSFLVFHWHLATRLTWTMDLPSFVSVIQLAKT